MISEKTCRVHEEVFNHLRVRKDKVICSTDKGKITIPSSLFPLNNQRTIRIFSEINTISLDNEKINEYIPREDLEKVTDIFNSFDLKIGECYSNANKLLSSLDGEIKEKVKCYSGWILTGNCIPVHHCWLVYNDVFVLDGISSIFDLDIINQTRQMTKDEVRIFLVEKVIEKEAMRNTEKCVFGRVPFYHTYIGSETYPQEGLDLFKRLIQQYPNHIAYSNEGQNAHGMSKFQEVYYNMKTK